MHIAQHNGQLVEAHADAPRQATCPACGRRVALRRDGHGGWSYCHIPDPLDESPRDCPLLWQPPATVSHQDRQLDPEYALALALIRRTVLDALDGGGIHLLEWLYCDAAQVSLQWLLGTDVETTLEITRQTVDRLTQIAAAGQGAEVRRALIWRGSTKLRELVWEGGKRP